LQIALDAERDTAEVVEEAVGGFHAVQVARSLLKVLDQIVPLNSTERGIVGIEAVVVQPGTSVIPAVPLLVQPPSCSGEKVFGEVVRPIPILGIRPVLGIERGFRSEERRIIGAIQVKDIDPAGAVTILADDEVSILRFIGADDDRRFSQPS